MEEERGARPSLLRHEGQACRDHHHEDGSDVVHHCAHDGREVAAAFFVTRARVESNRRSEGLTKLIAHKFKTGQVAGFPGAKAIAPEQVLTGKCDFLIPAALEDAISGPIAERIQARLIAEAANGPTTLDAGHILVRRGITVVPDVLANAGGVTVSYFEWVQNRQGFYWREREINERLVDYMTHAFQATFATTDKYKTNPRIGAYILALDRVAQAMKYRGFYA